MKLKKSKAFTLTELLIVVIVIGVLAALVLPKFTRIMETRKTTEAEDMMFAIRTEQERRCSLGKSYTTDFATLGNIVSSSDTAHYSFSLQAEGMLASRKENLAYDLRMPSYSDGRICCDDRVPGNECNSLNKDYMTCTALLARQDYQPDAACAADAPGPVVPPDPGGCPGPTPGGQSRTCDVNGVACGTQNCNPVCNENTHQWEWTDCGSCEPTNCGNPPPEGDCPPPQPPGQAQSCVWPDVGGHVAGKDVCGLKTRERECNPHSHHWSGWTAWDTSNCVRYDLTVPVTKPCTEIDSTRYMSGTANCLQDQTCQQHTVIPSGEPHDCDPSGCQCYALRWDCTGQYVGVESSRCMNFAEGNPDGQACSPEGASTTGFYCDTAEENWMQGQEVNVFSYQCTCSKVQVACQ